MAAAIKFGASVIVTFNLKDFPPDVLEPFEIEAMHPDDFIVDLFDLDQAAVILPSSRGHGFKHSSGPRRLPG